MSEEGSPLYQTLNEINKAASSGLPLLAIAMCVALPDICVSLSSDDGRTDGTRYREWCKKNLKADHFGAVTPDDLWSMRCGVLHNGRFGDLKHIVGRVIFLLPNERNFGFENCKFNDAYFYSVVEFCQKFTTAAYDWLEANKNDPQIQANMPRLMQYRDDLPPYMRGIQFVA